MENENNIFNVGDIVTCPIAPWYNPSHTYIITNIMNFTCLIQDKNDNCIYICFLSDIKHATDNEETELTEDDLGHCIDCEYEFRDISEIFTNEYDDNVRCAGCHDSYISSQSDESDYGEIPCRDYDEKFYVLNSKANLNTEIIQSKRGFGVELEAYGTDYNTIESIVDEIDERIGISGDGSLENKGFELQFPLINGLQAENLVKDTCQILSSHGTSVDHTCGYHVHLQKLPNEHSFVYLQRLLFVATIFDDVIMSFVPKSRRQNRFCENLRSYIRLDEIINAKTKQELETIWYKDSNYEIRKKKQSKYDSSRYHGFNFHAYLSKLKHLEVRHHTGTLNPDKILHWANLHTLLLDAVHREIDIEENITKWDKTQVMIDMFDNKFSFGTQLKEKTDFLFSFIGLSEKSIKHFKERQNKFNQ